MKVFYLVFIFVPIYGNLHDLEKVAFCQTLECDESAEEKVCGVKYGEEVLYKVFDNECTLMKYGCQVDDNETYGIINMKHCTTNSTSESEISEHVQLVNCTDCIEEGDPVCGIRPDGAGFKIRTFENECQLKRYNCDAELQFSITDYFICSEDPKIEEEENQINDKEESTTPVVNVTNNPVKTKNLVIVDGSRFNPRNINESIRHFFAATHVLDLPMREIQPMFNVSTRKRLLKVFGPVKVYKPWIRIPKNISDDHDHKPTLSSCYHKCPTKCPDTYAPVCGQPGVSAREPSLMFQNHCFMDVAQCKMSWEDKSYTAKCPDTYAPVCGQPGVSAREPSLMFQNHCFMDVAQCKMSWEDKSYTAVSSAYIESSFVFCLGDELNGLYRFLPLIKTLQHMGRLKKRGHYRYKLRTMKVFNQLMDEDPKLMG